MVLLCYEGASKPNSYTLNAQREYYDFSPFSGILAISTSIFADIFSQMHCHQGGWIVRPNDAQGSEASL
jgi:hypothetical protein